MMAGYPIVFLDVDGTLIPFRSRSAESALVATHSLVPTGDASSNPLLHRLDPQDGRRLLALRCRLVWATTWMADANDLVAPRLGRPELPVVDFPDDEDSETGVHWKTTVLTRWAAGRTFVRLDDEITDVDRRWVQAHYQGKALLHRVDPLAGSPMRRYLVLAAVCLIHAAPGEYANRVRRRARCALLPQGDALVAQAVGVTRRHGR